MVRTTRAALPYLRRSSRAAVVGTCSIAAAIVSLASPAAAGVTGTAPAVDGGMQGLRLRPAAGS